MKVTSTSLAAVAGVVIAAFAKPALAGRSLRKPEVDDLHVMDELQRQQQQEPQTALPSSDMRNLANKRRGEKIQQPGSPTEKPPTDTRPDKGDGGDGGDVTPNIVGGDEVSSRRKYPVSRK